MLSSSENAVLNRSANTIAVVPHALSASLVAPATGWPGRRTDRQGSDTVNLLTFVIVGATRSRTSSLYKYLKQPQMVMMLDAAHALTVAKKVAEALGQQLPPIELTCKTPLAIGAGVTGSLAHVVVFIPNDLVKDIVSLIKTFTGGEPATAPAKPVRGGESF